MKIAILSLNKGRGSGGVAKEHALYFLNNGHNIYFIHPNVGDGVTGAKNWDVDLGGKILPVHEFLPSAGKKQKAVSVLSNPKIHASMAKAGRKRAVEPYADELLGAKLLSWLKGDVGSQ